MDRAEHSAELSANGYTLLRGVCDSETVQAARRKVLENRHLFRNTRPTRSAGHLAGFHRFPQLEPLHTSLTRIDSVMGVVQQVIGADQLKAIGLSDITINRSQQWHNDLLRGQYRSHLNDDMCWGEQGGGVIKILLYLQKGTSLRVIPGSHLEPISLESDELMIPRDESRVVSLSVEPGDIILIDLRLTHRGSTEAEMQKLQSDADAKILISTVLGGASRELTHAMELGNFHRLMDWEERTRQSDRLSP